MAKNALLIWCAGSVFVCGSAALATTTLWRVPAPAAPARLAVPPPDARAVEIPLPDAPAEIAGLDDPTPPSFTQATVLPLNGVSFFSPTAMGSTTLVRSTIEDVVPAPVEPDKKTDFAEVVSETVAASDPRLAILPPKRPNFTLARLEAGSRAAIQEVQPASVPAPGFGEQPSNVLGGLFQQPAPIGRPERVINAGVASWYGPGFHGRKTASGERFDQNDMTAAHRTLPFGTRVKVVDEKTGRSIVVRINDRGPYAHGRVIDLSKQAAQALGMGGLARVKVVAAN